MTTAGSFTYTQSVVGQDRPIGRLRSNSMPSSEEITCLRHRHREDNRLRAYRLIGRPFRWGRNFIEPTVLYIPRDAHDRPPSPSEFARLCPPTLSPRQEKSELDYTPVVTLRPERGTSVVDDIYKIRYPPEVSFTPVYLPAETENVSTGRRYKILRQADYNFSAHWSIDPWVQQTVDPTDHRATILKMQHLHPQILRSLKPEDRDRLLDCFEDWGEKAWTFLYKTSDPNTPVGKCLIGKASTVALMMRVQGTHSDFGLIVGTRPIVIVYELTTMLGCNTFRLKEIPWLIYSALPRLRMNGTMEQGFSCCAVVAAVASALANAYGSVSEPASSNPEDIYKKFQAAASSIPAEIYQRLSARTDESQAFYVGMMFGVLMAGTFLYAEKAEQSDNSKRAVIKWAIQTFADLLVTAPVAAGAPPALAILIPVVNHLVKPLAEAIACEIVQHKHWLEVLKLSIYTLEIHMTAEGADQGNESDIWHFFKGYCGVIRVSREGRKMYERSWGTDPALAAAAKRHPHLHEFFTGIFDHNFVPKFLKRATLGLQP